MQPAIQFLDTSNRDRAAKRYPFSAKHNKLEGGGSHPVVIRCRVPWRIRLWTDRDDAVRDARQHCGDSRCTFDHKVEAEL